MKRTIKLSGEFDRPIELQVIQEADAVRNGDSIDLTFATLVDLNPEVFRAAIMPSQARKLLERLTLALNA
ncbi:MAG: hypothetical protein J0I29_12795 [Rhizobiales bacterium]|nr:hypothetical protein [Hyphomicrobiales bacterium]